MLPNTTSKPAKSRVPERIGADLDARATKLVEDVLKPRYVKPPPKKPQFNYITDVWTKWLGSTLYFGTTYACPGPNAISPSFESRFARMEHLGGEGSTFPTCGTRQVVQVASQPDRGRVPGRHRERLAFPVGLKGESHVDY